MKKDFVVVLADGNGVTYASGVPSPDYINSAVPLTPGSKSLDHVRLSVEGRSKNSRTVGRLSPGKRWSSEVDQEARLLSSLVTNCFPCFIRFGVRKFHKFLPSRGIHLT